MKNPFHEYLLDDVFGQIEGITSRRMFGGLGIYQYGYIFAIEAFEELYFKVDDTNRSYFEAFSESHPFRYQKKDGKVAVMSYWTLPEKIMNDRDLLPKWVERSVEVSKNKSKK